MAKAKTYEEALEIMEAAKAKYAELKEELREFKKEHKVRRDKPVEDAKIAAQLEKKEAALEKALAASEEAKEVAKGLKPSKDRVSKYEYPEDCVSDKDKKRYRTKMRRDAKKPEGEEKVEKKPLKKAAEAEEKPVKKVIKKVAAEEED